VKVAFKKSANNGRRLAVICRNVSLPPLISESPRIAKSSLQATWRKKRSTLEIIGINEMTANIFGVNVKGLENCVLLTSLMAWTITNTADFIVAYGKYS